MRQVGGADRVLVPAGQNGSVPESGSQKFNSKEQGHEKWMTYSIALALTFALWGGQDAQAAGPVFVDENADGIDDNVRSSYHRGRKGVLGRRGGSSQLTEAQREELKTLVDGLKESDTSKKLF